MANDKIIRSTHQVDLCLPSLDAKAQLVHLFPDLRSHALLSIGNFCDAGCTAILAATTIAIVHNNTNWIILKGTQSQETNKLWLLDLPSNKNINMPLQPSSAEPETTDAATTVAFAASTQPTTVVPAPKASQQPSPTTQLANATGQPAPQAALAAAIHQPNRANTATNHASATPAELVKFAHAALFSPSLSALQKALDNNCIHHFPGLTSQSLKKHPPQSAAMIKGHLDQSRKNQCSTKSTDAKTTPSLPVCNVPSDDTEIDSTFLPSKLDNHCTNFCHGSVIETPDIGKIFTNQTGFSRHIWHRQSVHFCPVRLRLQLHPRCPHQKP